MNSAVDAGLARILVIDDNPGDVQMLQLSLQRTGLKFSMQTLQDGGEALQYFKEYDENKDGDLPDLVILDLNLPKHDGFEIIQVIRNDDRFAALPVTFFSSSTSLVERSRMVEFPGTSYLAKPQDLQGYFRVGRELKEILANGHASVGA